MIKKIFKRIGDFFREETVEGVYQKTLMERRDSEDEDKVCLLGFYGHPERSNDIIERLHQLGAWDSDGRINLEKDSANPEKIIYIIFSGNKSTFLIHSLNKKNFLENNKPENHAIFEIDSFDSLYDIKVGDIVMVWPEKFEEKVVGFKFNPQTRKINFRLSSGKIKDYYSLTKIKSMEKKEFNLENFVKIESKGTGHLISINVPEGYKISSIDTETGQIEVKKENLAKLPKTYEECYRILGIPPSPKISCHSSVPGESSIWNLGRRFEVYFNSLSIQFKELLICRNAYWKVLGIDGVLSNGVKSDKLGALKDLISMPSEEILEEFYENFKDSIHHFLNFAC